MYTTIEVTLNGDKESSLLLTKNPEAQNRTRQIDVQRYICELINKKGTNRCKEAERQEEKKRANSKFDPTMADSTVSVDRPCKWKQPCRSCDGIGRATTTERAIVMF